MTKLGNLFLLFIIYSFIGWCIEKVVVSLDRGKLMPRGFLVGPWCPIYGFGGIFVFIFLTRYKEDPWALFISAAVIATLLEYYTSYIMEKLFNTRWWDYSKRPFNLNGRVTLLHTLAFGVLGFIAVYYINPFILDFISYINYPVVVIAMAILFVWDLIFTYIYMNRIGKKLEQEGVSLNDGDYTAEMRKEVNLMFIEDSKKVLRIFEAYPNFIPKFKLFNKENKNDVENDKKKK